MNSNLFNRFTVLSTAFALAIVCYAHPAPKDAEHRQSVPAVAVPEHHTAPDHFIAHRSIIVDPPVLPSEPDFALPSPHAPEHFVAIHPALHDAPPVVEPHPEREV